MGKSLGFALAIVLGCAATGHAAPLDLKQVAADAKWTVHVDFDALRASALFQKAWKQVADEHSQAEGGLALLKTMWNFDPRTDLHGVTFYGTQFKRDSGVAIINVKVDRARLLEYAKLVPDHRASNYGTYEVHSWLHAKGSRHERSFAGVMVKPDVLLLAASSAEVIAALDVFNGKNPNAVERTTALVGSVPSGAIVAGGAVGLGDAKLPVDTPVAKLADSFVLALGENQNEVFVQARLALKDAATAQQVKAVADGAVAMAALDHHDNAELLKLISAVKVTAHDKTVNVDGRAAVDAVWAAIEKAMKHVRRDFDRRGPPPLGPHGKKN
jgi:hypothetical protein